MSAASRNVIKDFLVIASLGLASICSPGAAPHPLTNQKCESCHAPQRIPTVDPQMLAHSVHAKLNCTDCHSDINNVPHQQKLEPVNCGGCHRKIVHGPACGGKSWARQ